MKQCSKCKEIKDLSEFYTHNKFGHRSECKKCSKKNSAKVWKKDKTKLTKRNRAWLDANKEKRTQYTKVQTLKKYGLTLIEYEQMLIHQDNKCKICSVDLSTVKQFDVDHCHKTGKVRGILCTNCNKGIGCLMDNPSLLRRAAEYLETV